MSIDFNVSHIREAARTGAKAATRAFAVSRNGKQVVGALELPLSAVLQSIDAGDLDRHIMAEMGRDVDTPEHVRESTP